MKVVLGPLPTAPDQRVSSQERLVPEICAVGGTKGGGTQSVRGQTAREQTASEVHERIWCAQEFIRHTLQVRVILPDRQRQ